MLLLPLATLFHPMTISFFDDPLRLISSAVVDFPFVVFHSILFQDLCLDFST